MRKAILTLGIAFSLALNPMQTMAHGGGLDSYGCHYDRKRWDYHCHEEEEEYNWPILLGLLGGAIIYHAIKRKGYAPMSQLYLTPHFNDEKEIGLVAEYIAEGPHRMGVKMYTDDRQNTYTGIHWRFDF